MMLCYSLVEHVLLQAPGDAENRDDRDRDRDARGEKMRSEKLSSSNKECATKSSNDYLILPGVQEFIFL